jgi:hypothetical protein
VAQLRLVLNVFQVEANHARPTNGIAVAQGVALHHCTMEFDLVAIGEDRR